ncbi:unnamed protein product [Alopecurus aequalis]
MAASHTPVESTPTTARATFTFAILGYSRHKGMASGKFLGSSPVSVGGYEWCIRYYPNGMSEDSDKDYITVYLGLLSKTAEVMALFDLRLINKASGLSSSLYSCLKSPEVFDSLDLGNIPFVVGIEEKSLLEDSALLQDECVVIECDLTVIKKPLVIETVEVQIPPSDLSHNFGKLLETAEYADVTFKVNKEIFQVHKIVLATRSPVFKAELYGPMTDKRRGTIKVKDMQPAVFKALLHFIYTDSLPSMEDLDDSENKEMVKHLLVAADRDNLAGKDKC